MRLLGNKNIRSYFIYSFGEYAKLASPILLLPILTRFLTKTDYGIISTFSALTSVLSVFVSFTATGAVNRAYMDRKNTDLDFKSYLGNAIMTNTFLSIILCFPLIIIGYLNVVNLPKSLFFIIPLILLTQSIMAYKQKLWILQEKPIQNSIFEASFRSLSLILSVLLVLIIFPDWRGRVIGLMLANLLFCVVSIFMLKKEDNFTLTYNSVYAKDILKFGAPLIFHGIGMSLVGAADRLILNNQLGLNEVGIYGVASAIASALVVFIMPFDKVIMPKMYTIFNNYDNENSVKAFKIFIFYVFYLCCSGYLFYLAAIFLGPFIIGEKFILAIEYIPVLIIAKIFYGLYRFSVMAIFYSKKTYLVSISTLSSGLIGILMMFLLVKNYGIIGVAWGFVLSNFLCFLFVFIFSQRLFPFPLFRKQFKNIKKVKL
jgi:O-antigen/teichoic acid export membrane protein